MAGSRSPRWEQRRPRSHLSVVVSSPAGVAGDEESLAEEPVTVPGYGHLPIRHVPTRSLLDELDWRLDRGPGLTAAAERKFLDAIRDARREFTVDGTDACPRSMSRSSWNSSTRALFRDV
jgi:hypothetical protein